MRQMRDPCWLALVACGGMLLGSSAPARSQESHGERAGNDSAASLRLAQCRAAGSILKHGPAHPRRAWAVSYVRWCPDEGPEFYAEEWRAAGADTSALEALVFYSARMRDARIYETAMDVARDRSRPDVVRVAAMMLLAAYADPGVPIVLHDLVPPDSITRIALLLGSSMEGPSFVGGSQPIPQRLAASVLTLLQPIAAARASEPRAVWYAAAVISRRLQRDVTAGNIR
jgi:hypothetical protein